MLTLREAKRATRLTTVPNLFLLALFATYYLVPRVPYRAGDDPLWAWAQDVWGFTMFCLAPVMFLVAMAGIAFSFQSILSRAERVTLWIIHGGAGAVAVWIMIVVAKALHELAGWRQY